MAASLDAIDPLPLTPVETESWFHLRGIAAWRLGGPGSLGWFEAGLARLPESGLLAFSAGQALEQVGRWDEASAMFDRVSLGVGPQQQRLGLAPVPPAYVMTIARYCYLWGAFGRAQQHLEQLLKVYGQLSIADDTFVYMRGLPLVNEFLATKCALSILEGNPAAAWHLLDWAEKSLTDMSVDDERLCLRAWTSGDWNPVVRSLESRSSGPEATAFAAYRTMRIAVIGCRIAPDLAAGLSSLDMVQLAPTDFRWLADIRTLATIGIATRFGHSELRDRSVAGLFSRQPLLFEPHHTFNFGLLDVQEPLRQLYQTARRAG